MNRSEEKLSTGPWEGDDIDISKNSIPQKTNFSWEKKQEESEDSE